jgi:hypothetical protein
LTFIALGIDARQSGRFGVAADGKHIAAKAGAGHQDRHRDDNDHHEQQRIGKAMPELGPFGHRLAQLFKVDLQVSGGQL